MGRFMDENGWELMDHNPHTGATYWRYFDGERMHYRTDHDVEELLKENKAAQAEFASKRAAEGVGDPVASIPTNVFFDQLKEAHVGGDPNYIRKWLNDSDNAAWRMKQGRV